MRIVILTGAGISAESGVKTFRDSDGLWRQHDVRELATPEAFGRNPALVHAFYDARRRQVCSVEPNAAHAALARLEREHPGEVTVVTQNVDDLHERAGSQRVWHMHGKLLSALCQACGGRFAWQDDLADEPLCPGCGEPALRPDVVWFGEMPQHLDAIDAVLADCDLFAAIGTSGEVYPAAGFVEVAAGHGARTVELNLRRSAVSRLFDEVRTGPATEIVPAWVDECLQGGSCMCATRHPENP